MRLVLTTTAALLFTALPTHADERSECLAGIARLRSATAARPAPPDRDTLLGTLRRAEREAGERQFDDCVGVLKASASGGGKSSRDDDDAEEGAETEDMFGFTEGTSILEKGKFEISGAGEGAFGKRLGRYRTGGLGGSFAFAPVDGLSIELGAVGNRVSIRDVPGLDNRHGGRQPPRRESSRPARR